jgi:hypothetical protein
MSEILHVSARLAEGTVFGGVNNTCHSYTGDGVTPHGERIIRHPRVVVIAWGHYYVMNPNVVTAGVQLLTDLVGDGGYLTGLAQYGVAHGTVVGSVTIDTDSANPAPATIDRDPIRDQLIQWLRGGTVIPAPAKNEDSLLYFVFPDPSTTLTLGTTTGFCGYHYYGKLNGSSDNQDVFFAAIRTDGRTETGADFMQLISYCVSHELAEALTDRDGDGFFDGACEISDICETKGNYTYRNTWTVEQYWSNWDKACINGERGVSLRRFVQAVNASPASLRSLGMADISIESIASRFP